MTNRVFLVHGWDGTPTKGWFPWMKLELEQQGFIVVAPQMPNPNQPVLARWITHLGKVVGGAYSNCYFVGHSLGCAAILRYIESLPTARQIGGIILVAGFAKDLNYEGYNGELASFYEKSFNWGKIAHHCNRIIAIHSDDDPFVSLDHAKLFKEKLGAEIVVLPSRKHFSPEDGATELPEALDLLIKQTKS